jgi:hypothetical protein
MSVDEMSVDEMSVDEMSVDKMSVDEMSADKMTLQWHFHLTNEFLQQNMTVLFQLLFCFYGNKTAFPSLFCADEKVYFLQKL